jgi:hypothetical protein
MWTFFLGTRLVSLLEHSVATVGTDGIVRTHVTLESEAFV